MHAVAITRGVSDAFAECELTHLARVPIDVTVARAQHDAYERALAGAGYQVERLPSSQDLPDAVFVEDIALVLDEVAIVTRPGAASRRGEIEAVEGALARYREMRRVEAPATLDGGDVLVAGRQVFVGLSSRTNREAVRQLRWLLDAFDYSVSEVAVGGCLHLKSAATAVAERVVLLNPEWVDAGAFAGFEIVTVDPREPSAANALRLRDRVLVPTAFAATGGRLRARGLRVETVDVSELAKAEGAVTCCSLIVERAQGALPGAAA